LSLICAVMYGAMLLTMFFFVRQGGSIGFDFARVGGWNEVKTKEKNFFVIYIAGERICFFYL